MSGDKRPMNLPVNEPDRDWSGPSEDDPFTLHDLLTRSVARNPDILAFGHIPAPGAPRIHMSYS